MFVTCNSYEIVTKRINACALVCAIIPLGIEREMYLWISKTFNINALNWNQSFNGQSWEKKRYHFFMSSCLFFFYLKITEIEYCDKSQEFKNICSCNLKVSVAAEVEFPKTPGCGSLSNFWEIYLV